MTRLIIKATEIITHYKIETVACAEVSVPIDQNVVQDLRLEKIDFVTVSGTVTVEPDGTIDPDDPLAVFVSFYADLSCGYVEITTLPVSPDNDGSLVYTVDLPLGPYDVVASAEGYMPDSGQAALAVQAETATLDLNFSRK